MIDHRAGITTRSRRSLAGVEQKSLQLRTHVAPVAAAVDAQAAEHSLIGPAADGIGVNAEHRGGVAHREELARNRCVRGMLQLEDLSGIVSELSFRERIQPRLTCPMAQWSQSQV